MKRVLFLILALGKFFSLGAFEKLLHVGFFYVAFVFLRALLLSPLRIFLSLLIFVLRLTLSEDKPAKPGHLLTKQCFWGQREAFC
jgi:hypothetical protein